MSPEDVPEELVELLYDLMSTCDGFDEARDILTTLLPAHEAMIRAKVDAERSPSPLSCGEPMPGTSGTPPRCTRTKHHEVHHSGGHAWSTDWDAWRAAIEQEARAKVAAEIEASVEREAPIGDFDPYGEVIEQVLRLVRGGTG